MLDLTEHRGEVGRFNKEGGDSTISLKPY